MDLLITSADHFLILEHLQLAPPLERALRAGLVEGEFLRFSLSEDEALELFATLLMTVSTRHRPEERQALEQLAPRIGEQMARAGLSLDDLNDALEQAQATWNESRKDELGGFSPEELHTLFSGDWLPDSPGLQLHADAPPELLTDSRLYHNARAMLEALMGDGAKVTTAGNLNRAFVARMVEEMRFPEGYIEELHEYNKVINEWDAWRVHDVRVLLELSSLIHIRKKRFVVRPMGRKQLTEGHEGDLFSRLVYATFRVYNLGYGDRLYEVPEFQQTIAYPLAILSRLPMDWHDYPPLAERLLHPAIAELMPRNDVIDMRDYMVRIRLIERLEDMGMVEVRREPVEGSIRREMITLVRKTELFDAVFSVEF